MPNQTYNHNPQQPKTQKIKFERLSPAGSARLGRLLAKLAPGAH
jgi:hypothetical protein